MTPWRLPIQWLAWRRTRAALLAYAAACDAARDALAPPYRATVTADRLLACAVEARRMAASGATREALSALARATPGPPWPNSKGRDAAGAPDAAIDRADLLFARLEDAAITLRASVRGKP